MSSDGEACIAHLISTYQELNCRSVEILAAQPSELQYSRFLAKNRPFVVRNACGSWPACRKWSATYLKEKLANTEISVAVTPNGRADAPTRMPSGKLVFAKPLEILQPFVQFLDELQQQEYSDSDLCAKYSQAQNDNLHDEYRNLLPDVNSSIAWVDTVLQRAPEAVNLWIGNSKSVTALHKDNYENIYCQMVGKKSFVLIPPIETLCVNERILDVASFTPADTTNHSIYELRKNDLRLVLDDPHVKVPIALYDPDQPSLYSNKFSAMCQPLKVELFPGDMLYLPALWYHKVSQSCGQEGFCCAVNYWYDMDMDGQNWAMNCYLHELSRSYASEAATD